MNMKPSAAHDVAALVEPIQRAVEHDRVTGIARVIAQLEESGAFANVALFADPHPDRYSRSLIWRDPAARFVIVGMTWAPGQFAPLHDHGGVWGVETVVEGTMKQTAFRLVDRDAQERYRFIREGEEISPKGTVGVVVPPLEYHAFANAGSGIARTVHVYGGAFERCQKFSHDVDGWWRAETVSLTYDA